jgi:isoleucyl-tRNA synthetase
MSRKYNEYGGLNLPNVAQQVLDKWKKEQVFDRSISSREGATPYVFFEGPPSANGLPGIHHVMARSIKDVKRFSSKTKSGLGYAWIAGRVGC